MAFDPSMLAGARWIADGAWSTELRARGWPADQAAELATATRPEMVSQLAGEYLAAGARFLCTNTFAANRLMMQRRKIAADPRELNLRAAQLARQAVSAAGAAAWVCGAIGPSGRILAVREAGEAELSANVAEQAAALRDGGVDAILFETFSELAELLMAVDAARSAAALPIIACMSFDSGPQRTRTMMGAEAAAVADALTTRGVDLIGSNCGCGAAEALPALVALRAHTHLPLWVKPNAGLPELDDGRLVYRQTPDQFADAAARLLEAGASVIGGCCGAGPEHIRRTAAVVSGGRPRALRA